MSYLEIYNEKVTDLLDSSATAGADLQIRDCQVCLLLFSLITPYYIDSVLGLQCCGRCCLGGRKGSRPVKTEWWGAGVVICRERGAVLHMALLMPLPLTVSCFSKIQIGHTFLVLAHLGSPGQRAVKRVCVY